CVTAEGADTLSGVAVPESDGGILPARGDPPAAVIGAERQGVDFALVSPEGGLEFFAGLYVPDLDRVLLASRRQPPAVRAEGHVHTRPRDPCAEKARFLLLVQPLRVPELHDPVAARRSEVLAIAAKHQSEDFSFVGIDPADHLAGLAIPHSYRSV